MKHKTKMQNQLILDAIQQELDNKEPDVEALKVLVKDLNKGTLPTEMGDKVAAVYRKQQSNGTTK